eukprot:11183867-Lingulodinium_polyedra.AAC.1
MPAQRGTTATAAIDDNQLDQTSHVMRYALSAMERWPSWAVATILQPTTHGNQTHLLQQPCESLREKTTTSA